MFLELNDIEIYTFGIDDQFPRVPFWLHENGGDEGFHSHQLCFIPAATSAEC